MTQKRKNTHRLEIVPEECKGCGRCVKACPKDLIKMSVELNEMGFPYAICAGQDCIGCGACFYNCPEPGTITVIEQVESDEEK